MKIKFLGAAGTVTGSSYALTSSSGKSILIDLGMFQGHAKIEELNYAPYDYDCTRFIGAVLTHAHLDHCGRLPILLPKGFRKQIFMTPATRDLTELSLLDSAKVAIQDSMKILYDKQLAQKTIDRFKTVNYGDETPIGDFAVRFRDAGHILGSAILEIEDMSTRGGSAVGGSAGSGIRKIVFSGDLGNFPEDLVFQTEFIDKADAVVMESTYGDRLHSEEDPSEVIKEEINAVEKSGGTLLIQAFALERTQEVLHKIMHLKKTGKIRGQTPIFLDSPMAESATEIYLDYPKLFNDHLRQDFKSGSPFVFPGLENIKRRNESYAIRHIKGPKVIIAGSGMMTGGRIVGHAAYYLSNSSTRLLIVGYQGEETLGRELMEGKKEVVIDGVNIQVKASVNTTLGMSSHADQGQLMDWLGHIQNVKKVFLTHGEDGPRKALSEIISKEIGIKDITLPVLNEEVAL